MTAAASWDRRGLQRALATALALGSIALTMRLGDHAYRHLPRPRPLEELSYFPSGQLLEPMALGHRETMADLVWIRAVQYYGEHRLGDNRFPRMAHVFDVLTTLAPHFQPAYVFGAFALAQEGFDFPAAERLLQRGIEANPRSGWLAFELGFLYYVRPGQRDLPHAAQYFEQAARQPDAPSQALRFAAFAREHAGSPELAYELWRELADTSPNHYLKAIAEREMARIRAIRKGGRAPSQPVPLSQPRIIFVPRPSR